MNQPEVKVGVYICQCGINIAATVDVEAVTAFAATLDNVVVARHYQFMCSEPGQEMIKKDIRELGLNRVVVASCSPRMHEVTFQGVLADTGLNPYYFDMANIREHCSWITSDIDKATEKAKRLIRGAVARVVWQEPLVAREVPVTPEALVVGGGIAGIQAALTIADAGFHVYLVEREPSIGGRMAQLDKTFPTLDCSACILTPKMVSVGRHPNISLLSYSEVVDVSGYVGNFKVKVRKKPRYVDLKTCTGCGLCAESDLTELKEAKGELWVDRIRIDESKCSQCGDCVQACLEENKETQGVTNIAVERRRFAELPPEEREGKPLETLMQQILLMDNKSRLEFWQRELSRCIKCYGCRDVCPVCICDECELESPEWISPGEIPPNFPLFHLIRAYHMADYCIGCGECEATCPMSIPLRTIQSLIRRQPPEMIFKYIPGLDVPTKKKLIKQAKESPVNKRGIRV